MCRILLSLTLLFLGASIHAQETSKYSRYYFASEPGLFQHDTVLLRGLFVNDTMFNGQDRWRTGSHQRSLYLAYEGQVRHELRTRIELLAPENLKSPDKKNDRPYAAIFELSYHKHWHYGKHHFSFGPKITLIGDQTGLREAQGWVHNAVDWPIPNVSGYQINGKNIIGAEFSWLANYPTYWGNAYPFLELETGARKRITTGVDVIAGTFPVFLLSREQTTGMMLSSPAQKYSETTRYGLTVGADVSYVTDSVYFDPSVSNVKSEPLRYRLRAGIMLHRKNIYFYTGTAYLSPEFDTQREGQFVQAFSLEIAF